MDLPPSEGKDGSVNRPRRRRLARAANGQGTVNRWIGTPGPPRQEAGQRLEAGRGLVGEWGQRRGDAGDARRSRLRQDDHAARRDGRPAGGPASPARPRWVRMRRTTRGSSIVASTRIRPPQFGQANTSTANTREPGPAPAPAPTTDRASRGLGPTSGDRSTFPVIRLRTEQRVEGGGRHVEFRTTDARRPSSRPRRRACAVAPPGELSALRKDAVYGSGQGIRVRER